ncbi:hypothetical protein FA95DRAFT_1553344 [Auriscalpium vulgare]|uniref:Uncharacterized protein n=1 Tax=Auriscalpium vulgare TaxID=40419 RepID=A0ACB8S8G0_9AGAM|nr:hypothetical protein FA95DRAFT_1553344 [Auriscalpium vulgare]
MGLILTHLEFWVSNAKGLPVRSLATIAHGFPSVATIPRLYLLKPIEDSARHALSWLIALRNQRWTQVLWRLLPSGRLYQHYKSTAEEQRYWDVAARWRHRLAASDARFGGLNPSFSQYMTRIPLLFSYVPSLLPDYRDQVIMDEEGHEFYLSPMAYRKWHIMVYPGEAHPNMRDAAKAVKYLSMRDRREIHRISRLLRDEDVSRTSFEQLRTSTYSTMWTRYLDCKGPDLAIVFE